MEVVPENNVVDMGGYIARKLHEQELSEMRYMRATNALRRYDNAMERLRDKYGEGRRLRLITGSVLRLVTDADQQ